MILDKITQSVCAPIFYIYTALYRLPLPVALSIPAFIYTILTFVVLPGIFVVIYGVITGGFWLSVQIILKWG